MSRNVRPSVIRLCAAAALMTAFLAACTAAPTVPPSLTVAPATPIPTTGRTTAPPSPGPSPAATPTAPPPGTPTPSPPPDSAVVRVDSFALVVTDDLRVRTQPRVSDDSVRLEPLLWDGALVFVMQGPVTGSGYDWFLVRPLGEADVAYHAAPPQLGWVAAAAKDGRPWLAETGAPCDRQTPLDLLSDFDYPPHGLLGLACFGGRSVAFDARLVSGLAECDPPSGLEPAWLDPCRDGLALKDPSAPSEEPLQLPVVLDPSINPATLPPHDTKHGALMHVEGRFDHPAAASCRLPSGPTAGSAPIAPELVVLGCRTEFVVTSIAVR